MTHIEIARFVILGLLAAIIWIILSELAIAFVDDLRDILRRRREAKGK